MNLFMPVTNPAHGARAKRGSQPQLDAEVFAALFLQRLAHAPSEDRNVNGGLTVLIVFNQRLAHAPSKDRNHVDPDKELEAWTRLARIATPTRLPCSR